MKKLILYLIKIYQKISAHTPPRCRFYPTCSEYAKQAIEKYGLLKGGWLSIKRICRCHPLNEGGYYILPNCSSTSCLDLYTGKPENGKNIEIWKYNMLGSQRWYLAGTAAKPFISGQSIPENMKQGSSFDIRGIISSGENITSVCRRLTIF